MSICVAPYRVDRAAVMTKTEAIKRDPSFSEALDRYCAAGLDRFDGDPRTSKMICHVARYTLALAILHLDATAGPDGVGASASRLQAMLTSGGFASAGWVKNAVRVFQRAGYLDRAPSRGDRRFKRAVPSAMMVAIAEEALTPMLHAVDRVVPLPLPAAELARVPGFVAAAASHTIVPYLTDGFTPLEAFPEIRLLLLHDFGFIVLCYLLRTMHEEADGSIAAEAPSLVLSRRFGASRGQARNLIAVCTSAGWIEQVGRGGYGIRITPFFAELCRRWVAHDLACWSRVVERASHDLGLSAR